MQHHGRGDRPFLGLDLMATPCQLLSNPRIYTVAELETTWDEANDLD